LQLKFKKFRKKRYFSKFGHIGIGKMRCLIILSVFVINIGTIWFKYKKLLH